MKTVILCIIVITNINSNSRASLENFLPTSNNVILDTTKISDKSCYRPCEFNAKPRRCHYDFEILPTVLEDGRLSISVNGQTPGPAIQVCLHDIIVVKVKNKVPNQDLAIHWNGIEQKETPYSDGVPMITQCPITFGSIYKYAFVASSPGTFFYHADSVSQQSDGVYGPLIVDQPKPREQQLSLYDIDKRDHNTIIIGAKFSKLLTGSLENLQNIKPDSIVMNGQETNYKTFVVPGNTYIFRLINAIAIECAINVNIDGHSINVIASDGKPVKPTLTRTVKLYPGERLDVVVRANHENGAYWIKVSGNEACESLRAHGMLIYSGFNYTSMLSQEPINYGRGDNAVYGQMLQSLRDLEPSKNVLSVYLGIDRNYPKYKEDENEFRYLSDAMPKQPFVPAAISLQEGVVQINGKNFLYPNVPYLLKPNGVMDNTICHVGEETQHEEPQCIQVLNVKQKEVIELILVNEGFGSNDSYTFHMHGYNMQVLATWKSPAALPLSKEEFLKLDKEGKIERNQINPPIKNTIHVPNKGYTIVRLTLDFSGSWLLECRSCGLSALPVAVLINVEQSLPKLVVDSLPKCSGYKPADVLLN